MGTVAVVVVGGKEWEDRVGLLCAQHDMRGRNRSRQLRLRVALRHPSALPFVSKSRRYQSVAAESAYPDTQYSPKRSLKVAH